MVRNVFYGRTQLFDTLNDNIFGTRAVDNQFKTLSNKKADRGAETSDVIADGLFRIVHGIHLRRRVEINENAVSKLMLPLLEGGVEQAFNVLTFTADRGYGNERFTNELHQSGVRVILFWLDHLLRCHPFSAQSFFHIGPHDEVSTFSNCGKTQEHC